MKYRMTGAEAKAGDEVCDLCQRGLSDKPGEVPEDTHYETKPHMHSECTESIEQGMYWVRMAFGQIPYADKPPWDE